MNKMEKNIDIKQLEIKQLEIKLADSKKQAKLRHSLVNQPIVILKNDKIVYEK
jgi:hypothetical protein